MTLRLVSALVLTLFIVAGRTQTTALSESQLAWLKANAVVVKSVEAGTGFEDLQKLKAIVGDARIVSLGEATHGTREIFQMKHRLVEFLASEMGFSIFAIEANLPEAYRVNDYVLYGKGDPKALLRGMYFWTWNTEEVLAMIEWMREFNASGRGRIQFTGFDMQTISVAMEVAQDFFNKVDAEYAATARSVFQEANNLRPAQTRFGVATGSFPVDAAAGRKIRFSGAIKTNEVDGFAGLWWRADGPGGVLAFDNMQTRGPRGTTDWKRYEVLIDVPREIVNINFGVLMPGTGAAWFDDLQLEVDGKPYDGSELFDFDFESGQIKGFVAPAAGYQVRVDTATASRGARSLKIESVSAEPNAKTIDAAEASGKIADVVAHMERARSKYLEHADAQAVDWAIQNARVVHQFAQMTAGEASRDESMARNARWILDTAPKGTRIILWAHNGHVGRATIGKSRAMGAHLDDWYGKQQVVVGFAVNRGEYTAVGRTSGLGRHPLTPGEPGTFEHAVAASGLPRFILDLRTARPDDPRSGWLHTTMNVRSIGAMAMERQFYPSNLGKMFDVIVYLDETTATRSLAMPQLR